MALKVPAHLVEVDIYEGPGYQPVFDYGAWRVAMLRYTDELLPENISNVERHDETDEIFVLLTGRCMLFLLDEGQPEPVLYGLEMEPLKFYNVKKGQWHNHVLSRDANVLIVENRDTGSANSTGRDLSEAQRRQVFEMADPLIERA